MFGKNIRMLKLLQRLDVDFNAMILGKPGESERLYFQAFFDDVKEEFEADSFFMLQHQV